MTSNGEKSAETHYQLPGQKTIDAAGALQIKDENNKTVKFADLYTGKPEGERQLIVFIRHFFCGYCEEYVRALMREIPPSRLAAASVKLTIIGCGEAVCIPDYMKRTGCEYEIYCDPRRALYNKLDMAVNLKGGKQPDYFTQSMMGNILSSLKNAITSGMSSQGGKYSQNGGEWLFQGGEVEWCRRMRNTMDHAEVKELKEVLELKE